MDKHFLVEKAFGDENWHFNNIWIKKMIYKYFNRKKHYAWKKTEFYLIVNIT